MNKKDNIPANEVSLLLKVSGIKGDKIISGGAKWYEEIKQML